MDDDDGPVASPMRIPLHRPAQDRDEPGRAWDSMMDSPKAPWTPQNDPKHTKTIGKP